MSCSYAEGLSTYENKGVLGQKEKFDSQDEVMRKCNLLSKWISESENVVVHTGAGISTSAGIPDFRPKWCLDFRKKGEKPTINISFEDALPTKTHMALAKLVEMNKIKYVISQNIDGLHLKSGISRKYLAELHGNMFTEQCNVCKKQFVRSVATTSVGQKCLNIPCKGIRSSGRACRGKLFDTILDWEDNLPQDDLFISDVKSSLADLSICLGTTMQIVPSGNLPLNTKKKGGRLVIVNLQPTKHDRKADLIINTYVDDVFQNIMNHLNIEIPSYSTKKDFTKLSYDSVIDWSINNEDLEEMKRLQNMMLVNNGKLKKKNLSKSETSNITVNDFERNIDMNHKLNEFNEIHDKKKIKIEDKYTIKIESNQALDNNIEVKEEDIKEEFIDKCDHKIEIESLNCNETFENSVNILSSSNINKDEEIVNESND